jgi:ABC-2 type transport system permease protein
MSTTTDRTVPPVALAVLHLRMTFLETLRVPIAVIGATVFPALAMLFFVVPQQELSSDAQASTAATAQLAVFGVLSVCIFQFGIGVAEERALPFDPYLRTLPAAPGPRLAGRVLTGAAFALLGLLPLALVAALLTEAAIDSSRLLPTGALLALVTLPFLLLGLAIGYAMSAKAAMAMAQVLVFPLAFAGGLFVPPETFPRWLDALSQALPSRAARDLVVTAATGGEPTQLAVGVLATWTVLLAVLLRTVYRRDEGRRFR